MGGFPLDWLDLRAPQDRKSRSATLAARFAAAVAGAHRPATVLDLGAGAGANALYLAPYLDRRSRWILVDNDPALLQMAQDRAAGVGLAAEILRLDLAADLGSLSLDRAAGVSASALMDLVSGSWFADLAGRCAAARLPLLFVLTYDGRLAFSPADPADGWICDGFNVHQRQDKGFGPALGPSAVSEMARILADFGYRVDFETSDWSVTTEDGDLLREVVDGVADAVLSVRKGDVPRIESWRGRRHAEIADRALSLVIGHADLLALPPV
ncbi:MAG: class I SAM-dependent methyltransferase [Alphaproteobacteria bacterium]|nr:class I SAM-dependent methyltransferase [Alphaproteobacteria bacterium]